MPTLVTRLAISGSGQGATDWREVNRRADHPALIQIEGRYRAARRCIDAPRLDLSAVEGAASYEVVVIPGRPAGVAWSVRSEEPQVDLAAVWPELSYGPLQLMLRAWDETARLIGIGDCRGLARSPDWSGQRVVPLDYQRAGRDVIDYLINRVSPSPTHPDDLPYLWHANVSIAGPPIFQDTQFPALCYPSFIDLFLTGWACGMDEMAGTDLRRLAGRICDRLIDHPAVTSGPLAGAPFSTIDQQGKGGMFEQDRITLVRLGWLGRTALRLARATGNDRYSDYARRLADILVALQQGDGSWPYRVRLSDGAIMEPYTAAGVMALLLLEQLETEEPNGRYAQALHHGTTWVLENPTRTGLWQQMYEDVETREPYTNLEQWAALETAMFLLRQGHPGALEIASGLIRYVEDEFVIFGEELVTPTPYLPFTPCAMEQYSFCWPMDSHTANYARATLAMYRATGEGEWLDKATAAANTVVRCQLPDGRLSTFVPDSRLGVAPDYPTWFNCMAHAASMLLQIGPVLAGRTDAR